MKTVLMKSLIVSLVFFQLVPGTIVFAAEDSNSRDLATSSVEVDDTTITENSSIGDLPTYVEDSSSLDYVQQTEGSTSNVMSTEESNDTSNSSQVEKSAEPIDPYFPLKPSEEDLNGDKVQAGDISLPISRTRMARVQGMNAEIIALADQGVFKRASINQQWRSQFLKFPYLNAAGQEVNAPLGIVVHETANPTSNIWGEIAYMDKNWKNAFVHAFVDQGNIVEIHDPRYAAWGAGRVANKYYLHVELCEHVGNRTAFMKSLLNDATYIASKLIQFGLYPSRPSGKLNDISGSIWSHAEVTSYLGGTDHTDPNGYFAKFGYTMSEFYALIEHEYYRQLDPAPPVINSAAVTSINAKQDQFEVTVDTSAKAGIKEVRVPVWTQDNQSDIKWITAKKDSNGLYKATVTTTDFKKKTGPFNVHIYSEAFNKNIVSAVVAPVNVDYTPPVFTSKRIENVNNTTGTFDVVFNVSAGSSGIKTLRVPVWSETDQSDLKYYDAVLQSDGSYKVTVDRINHHYNVGPYTVHAYATTGHQLEASVNVGQVSFNVQKPSVVTKIVDRGQQNIAFDITSEVSNYPENIVIQHLIWKQGTTENTAKTIVATKDDQTKKWLATVDVKNIGQSGQYNVKSQLRLSNGNIISVGQQKIVISDVKATGKIDYNKETGKAKITIQTISKSGVVRVRVPIWSKDNQSNLVWYDAVKKADNIYEVDFDYLKHGGDIGKYTVHAYVDAINGINESFKIGEINMVRPGVGLVTNIQDSNGNQSEFLLTAKVNDAAGVKNVSFPVWSQNNGQDDIKWYAAKYNTKTKLWEAKVKVSDHKSVGKYLAHAYLYFNDGIVESYGTSGFNVDPITIKGSTTLSGKDDGRATVNIKITGNTKLKEVKVPIWSKADQSDLKWYVAKKTSEGNYQVDFDYKNHKGSIGKYTAHVYAYGLNGLDNSVALAQFEIKRPNVGLVTNIQDSNGNQSEFLLTAKVNDAAGVKNVSFPVWSQNNGQDDIKWYAAKYNTKTKLWEAKVKVSDHKSVGKYLAHAYLYFNDGTVESYGTSGFNVDPITIKGSTTLSGKDDGRATVNIKITGNTKLKEVKVPIWSKADQSDLKWYVAKKTSEGNYQVDFDYKNHKGSIGKYTAHVYAYGLNGLDNSVALAQFEIKRPNVGFKVSFQDEKKDETQFKSLAQINPNADVKKINFSVWTDENGQDDIKQYEAKAVDRSSWETVVKTKSHQGTGHFSVKANLTYGNGQTQEITTNGFDTSAVSISGEIDRDSVVIGKATIQLNVSSQEGITKVRVPIWSKPDQSDLKWYDARHVIDDIYKVDFDISNHNRNRGIYTVHAYAYTKKDRVSAKSIGSVVVNLTNGQTTAEKFIDTISTNARNTGIQFGLYPSIIVAQGCLESSYGQSELASNANNLFGIKGSYYGNYYDKKTTEYIGGVPVEIIARFRKYPSKIAGVKDYADKIRNGPGTNAGDASWKPDYYSAVWRENAKTYSDAANGLQGKYATDPKYASKLVSLIKSYDLYTLD